MARSWLSLLGQLGAGAQARCPWGTCGRRRWPARGEVQASLCQLEMVPGQTLCGRDAGPRTTGMWFWERRVPQSGREMRQGALRGARWGCIRSQGPPFSPGRGNTTGEKQNWGPLTGWPLSACPGGQLRLGEAPTSPHPARPPRRGSTQPPLLPGTPSR